MIWLFSWLCVWAVLFYLYKCKHKSHWKYRNLQTVIVMTDIYQDNGPIYSFGGSKICWDTINKTANTEKGVDINHLKPRKRESFIWTRDSHKEANVTSENSKQAENLLRSPGQQPKAKRGEVEPQCHQENFRQSVETKPQNDMKRGRPTKSDMSRFSSFSCRISCVYWRYILVHTVLVAIFWMHRNYVTRADNIPNLTILTSHN